MSGAEDAELLERSHYLAGYVCLRDGRYTKAGESLARIPVNSSYYGPARYLSAMRHLAVANQTAAAEILRELANKTSYPWSQSQSADFRNLARMKLGYLHYENGEYDQAIAYFSMVSPGHSGYQRSLIGRAWAHLKLQHFERSLSLANILIRDHFDSETTYEALVLAAHNKRQLGQEESALNDLRYVTSTKGYLDAAKVFGAERQRLLAQLGELNEMEHAAIVDIITAYLAEGDSLFRALSDWQAMLVAAENAGNTDAAGAASSRIAELNRVLTVQQAGLLRQKSRLYRERPLPVREIAAGYNRKLVAGLSDEIETERTALTARLHEIASLKAELGEERQRLQLDVLSAGLASLQRQANRLQSWLATRDTEQPDTDFQNWANISGMGVSDITACNSVMVKCNRWRQPPTSSPAWSTADAECSINAWRNTKKFSASLNMRFSSENLSATNRRTKRTFARAISTSVKPRRQSRNPSCPLPKSSRSRLMNKRCHAGVRLSAVVRRLP